MLIDAQALDRRKEQLKSRRSVVEDEWRKCFRYTHPLRGVGFESMGIVSGNTTQQLAANAQAALAELLDSTGTDSADILAAALMSGLTPASSRWVGFDAGDETDEEKRWLDAAAEWMWVRIHASNYDAVGFDCMLDMVIAGMFPMFVDEAPEGGYRFEEWPLANTYFAASIPGGPVDTVFNEFPLSAEQAVKTYEAHMLSEKLRKLAEDKPDEQVTFVRCVYPRTGKPAGRFARNLPYASVHYEQDTRKVVRESGYHEQPIGVPRWNVIPGSVYAFGQVSKALPDMKTLNEVVRFDLANMDLAIAGMWGAVDDGVLNAREIKIGPRKVVVMAEKDNFWALKPASEFQVAVLEIERLQRSIRKLMMADQLEPQGGPVKSATEIVVRTELIRQLLGPVYGRMQSEYLQWLAKRCFGIGYRSGAMTDEIGPAPRSLMDRVLTVRYMSPIARAQQAQDVAAMDRYEMALGAQIQAGMSDAADVYDWDEARRTRAELLGVPAKLIPDQDVIDERRKQKTEAAAQAQQQATMADVAAEAMKSGVTQ